jgi:hypothetical protein
MNGTNIKFERGELVIAFEQSADQASMTWRGVSDSRNPDEFLEPVFRHVLFKAQGCQLEIDFTELEFMNSSTVSPIISLLKKLDAAKISTSVIFSDVDGQQTHMPNRSTACRSCSCSASWSSYSANTWVPGRTGSCRGPASCPCEPSPAP